MDIPLPPSPSAIPDPVVLAEPEPSNVEYSPSHITSDDDEKFVPSKVIEKVNFTTFMMSHHSLSSLSLKELFLLEILFRRYPDYIVSSQRLIRHYL
jgi:hypothetical protein